ncbi:MAG: 1-acyl-sn-glycerol-3-phosphate acyltransferase, partial [Gaiellales bacterium]
AIGAAPTADVIFYGHAGLEGLSTPGELWRGIPVDSPVRTRRWLVRAGELPDPNDRELWLYDRWEQLDTWIGQQLAGDGRSRRE